MKFKFILFGLLTVIAITGCQSTNPANSFADVGQEVQARTGLNPLWLRAGATNADVKQTVAALLKTNLTAQTASAIAVLNSPALQAEFEEVGISQADLAQASRLQNIEIAGTWRFPNGPPFVTDVEYSAAGNFLDLLTLPARKKIAARNLAVTKLRVAGKVLQLTTETQSVFYRLQAQLQIIARLKLLLQTGEAEADFAQRQLEAGNIDDLEFHAHQALALQAHLDLMRAQAEELVEREDLNRLMGLAAVQLGWQTELALPVMPETEISGSDLEGVATNQRLDLAVVRGQKNALEAALRLKGYTRFVPGVMVGVDTERQNTGPRITGPTVDLQVPIFDQGQPALARLRAACAQARDNYAAAELNVRSEVRVAQGAVTAAREASAFAQKDLLPLRRQIFGETLKQYNAMQLSNYELLEAKEREEMAERASVEALRDYWLARVELERAVGGRLPSGAPPTARAN